MINDKGSNRKIKKSNCYIQYILPGFLASAYYIKSLIVVV